MTLFKSRDTSEIETSVETEVEGEIREFVRRDVATLRRHAENDSEIVASNINSLLQRVAGTSIQEIDKLIAELQTLRDRLSTEAARVQREIVEYATLEPGGDAIDEDHRREHLELEEGAGRAEHARLIVCQNGPEKSRDGAGRRAISRSASAICLLQNELVARHFRDHLPAVGIDQQDPIVELDELVAVDERQSRARRPRAVPAARPSRAAARRPPAARRRQPARRPSASRRRRPARALRRLAASRAARSGSLHPSAPPQSRPFRPPRPRRPDRPSAALRCRSRRSTAPPAQAMLR